MQPLLNAKWNWSKSNTLLKQHRKVSIHSKYFCCTYITTVKTITKTNFSSPISKNYILVHITWNGPETIDLSELLDPNEVDILDLIALWGGYISLFLKAHIKTWGINTWIMTINMMVLLQKCSFVKLCTIIHNSLKHALKDVVVIFFRMTVVVCYLKVYSCVFWEKWMTIQVNFSCIFQDSTAL